MYQYITRKDTFKYSIKDIQGEIKEWEQILSNYLHQNPCYFIREIKISSRLTSTLAKTGKNKGYDNYGHITINETYLRQHSDPINFHTTLAHEVIHTFPGCFNHGEYFKRASRILSREIPNIVVTRLGNDPGYIKFLNQYKQQQKTDKPKWVITCENCGQRIYRERMCSLVKQTYNFKCGVCGGKFKVEQHMPDGTIVKHVAIRL